MTEASESWIRHKERDKLGNCQHCSDEHFSCLFSFLLLVIRDMAVTKRDIIWLDFSVSDLKSCLNSIFRSGLEFLFIVFQGLFLLSDKQHSKGPGDWQNSPGPWVPMHLSPSLSLALWCVPGAVGSPWSSSITSFPWWPWTILTLRTLQFHCLPVHGSASYWEARGDSGTKRPFFLVRKRIERRLLSSSILND